MTENPDNRTKSPRWLAPAGLMIALFGLVSYFTVFARVAALRDHAWLNLGLVSLGTVLTVVAFWKRRNLWRGAASVLALLAGVLLFWYVYGLSSNLPGDDTVVAEGAPAPAFSLADSAGTMISGANFPERALLIVFYRGFW